MTMTRRRASFLQFAVEHRRMLKYRKTTLCSLLVNPASTCLASPSTSCNAASNRQPCVTERTDDAGFLSELGEPARIVRPRKRARLLPKKVY